MTLRILQVSKEYQPLSSGVARHIQGLVQVLSQDASFRLCILVPELDASSASCPVEQVHYLNLWRKLGDSDLVHVHGARTPFTALAAIMARLRTVAVVYTPHCYYDTGSPLRRGLKRLWDLSVERLLVRSAGAVVLLHEGWVGDLAQRGLHPRRVLIVPNCIDARRPAGNPPEALLDGKPALLSIGRLDPVKRLDDVLQALQQPPLAEACLHIVGRGDDRVRLETLAGQLGVAARVRFHGWQDDEASARMMAGCDAMVLASAREGMPTVVLEALLAGVPMACSDIDGNRAILNKAGWDASFPLGDVPALAACAAATAQRQVPLQVREAIRREFTWHGQAPRLGQLYRELASPGAVRPGWHRRLALKLSNYDDPRSWGSRMRARRMAPLLAMIDKAFEQHGHVNVIDVGGTARYWQLLPEAYLESRQVSITLVNLQPVALPVAGSRFTFLQADGCDLRGVATDAFHIAHSNSVIEHVGDHGRMLRFAQELQRVAQRFYIQTPDFWFPVEPHCMTPVFHWLPRSLRLWLVRHRALGHWRRAASKAEAGKIVDSARLLSKREFQAMLPQAKIIRERVLGFPKSLIAVSS